MSTKPMTAGQAAKAMMAEGYHLKVIGKLAVKGHEDETFDCTIELMDAVPENGIVYASFKAAWDGPSDLMEPYVISYLNGAVAGLRETRKIPQGIPVRILAETAGEGFIDFKAHSKRALEDIERCPGCAREWDFVEFEEVGLDKVSHFFACLVCRKAYSFFVSSGGPVEVLVEELTDDLIDYPKKCQRAKAQMLTWGEAFSKNPEA